MPINVNNIEIKEDVIAQSGLSEIVTNGLVFYTDLAQRHSYPTGGSTIYDISGTSNATLFGSPTFSRESGGLLSCDTSQTVAVNDKTATDYYTMWAWIRWDSNGPGESILFNKESTWESRIDNGIMNWAVYTSNQTWFWNDSGGRVTQGVPTFVAYSYDGNNVKTYKDGVLVENYTYPSGGVLANQTDAYPKFNSRGTNFGAGTSPGNNTLYIWAIYNRALTDAEILLNYDLTKNRFRP